MACTRCRIAPQQVPIATHHKERGPANSHRTCHTLVSEGVGSQVGLMAGLALEGAVCGANLAGQGQEHMLGGTGRERRGGPHILSCHPKICCWMLLIFDVA